MKGEKRKQEEEEGRRAKMFWLTFKSTSSLGAAGMRVVRSRRQAWRNGNSQKRRRMRRRRKEEEWVAVVVV